jgi:hypothetical protein
MSIGVLVEKATLMDLVLGLIFLFLDVGIIFFCYVYVRTGDMPNLNRASHISLYY